MVRCSPAYVAKRAPELVAEQTLRQQAYGWACDSRFTAPLAQQLLQRAAAGQCGMHCGCPHLLASLHHNRVALGV